MPIGVGAGRDNMACAALPVLGGSARRRLALAARRVMVPNAILLKLSVQKQREGRERLAREESSRVAGAMWLPGILLGWAQAPGASAEPESSVGASFR